MSNPADNLLISIGLHVFEMLPDGAEQIQRPFVGVASSRSEAVPCNFAQMRPAPSARRDVDAASGTPREFCTKDVHGIDGEPQITRALSDGDHLNADGFPVTAGTHGVSVGGARRARTPFDHVAARKLGPIERPRVHASRSLATLALAGVRKQTPPRDSRTPAACKTFPRRIA